MSSSSPKTAAFQPKKVAKNVHIASTPEGANLGLVATDDGAVCIDVPYSAQDAEHWRAEIARITDKPLRAILLTSPDRFNAEALSVLAQGKLRTPVLIQDQGFQNLYSVLEANYPHAPDLGIPFHVREQAGLPDLTFSERATITLGSRENPVHVDISHVGGCAPGASYVTIRHGNADSGIVFVGDHVSVGEPPVFGPGDFEKWTRALATLAKSRTTKLVVPGRGTPGGVEVAEPSAEFVKALRALVARVMRRESATRDDIAQHAPELVAMFDTKRKTRAEQQMVEEQYAVRIRTGLEAVFDAAKKQSEAVIV